MLRFVCLQLAAAVIVALLTHQGAIAQLEPMPNATNMTNSTNMTTATDAFIPETLKTAAASANLTTLLDAIDAVGWGDTLLEANNTTGFIVLASNRNASFTIFAPTNKAFMDAFSDLGVDKTELFANKTLLQTILLFHIVPGLVPSKAAKPDGKSVMTLLGKNITLITRKEVGEGDTEGKDATVYVKGYETTAEVLTPDVIAGESLIHVIDKVLVPEM